MLFFRRRLVFWLIKEYIKKWGKTLVLFFIFGLIGFFILRQSFGFFIVKIPIWNEESIGIAGAYTLDNLPSVILNDLSYGLTELDEQGIVKPRIAKSWKVEDNGKKYVFTLRDDIFFNDGTKLTAETVKYNFSDARAQVINKHTISYSLNDQYSPFLVSVSRPLFKEGLTGIGEFEVNDIKLNGNFAESIILTAVSNPYRKKIYNFYPNFDSLKIAYVIGEVSKIIGVTELNFNSENFSEFPNTEVKKTVNYSQMVTVFYNTKDNFLSDRNVRSGLSFALPDEFAYGIRNRSLYPKTSWAYVEQSLYEKDIEQAEILTASLKTSSKPEEFTIKTLARYKDTAEIVSSSWKEIGIESKIEVVDKVPISFQVFVGDFFVPLDPDQYRLWHSAQETNITRYSNQRIDKLLEDGRKITGIDERKKIYSDLQKYLLADAPASFLYFPYENEIRRK